MCKLEPRFCTKDQSAFWGHQKLFLRYKRFFSGYSNVFLFFSEVKGVQPIVKFLLTFWKVECGKGGRVQRTVTLKAAAKSSGSSSESSKRSTESSHGTAQT